MQTTQRLPSPRLALANRQRAVPFDFRRLSATLENALPLCLREALELGGPLGGLDCVDCSVLGTRSMSCVHRSFLGIQGPTDVITFPYGEILVCATVAADRAAEFGHDVTAELALYAIHGLLHLAGYDDKLPRDAQRMEACQARILGAASFG